MVSPLGIGIAPLWQMTVEQYHAMIERGILSNDDPVELLEGIIVCKMSKRPPHSSATRMTRRALESVIPDGWYVDEQEPITLENSEPEPDVMVIPGNPRDYSSRHPGPGDVAIVVEVSDSTVDRDRVLKKRIYARAGIPCCWLADINQRHVEVYRQPKGSDYQLCAIHRSGEAIEVELAGAVVGCVQVKDLLP